jgi:hypothetical protein
VNKLSVPKQFVERSGGEFQRQDFTIAATAEAFRILSEGLYSDKIQAIVRELSTNAVDSHIMAGNSNPFDVHLPSSKEPWFTVKDYGVGLSHEDVMGLYTTYFGTNKGDDNNTTGCFGLGSKSPLSKVRSFSVISRYGGVERHYIVSINEERLPEINYLPEQDRSVNYTGMEIQVAVNSSDIYYYVRNAELVYSYFDEKYRPNISNNTSYKTPVETVILCGNKWKITQENYNPLAVQGNVVYPINAEKIKGITTQQRALLQSGVIISFKNNELMFTPSREHLSYNKITCDNILVRLDSVIKDIANIISADLANCKTLWEARVLVWGLLWSSNSRLKCISDLTYSNFLQWNGQNISSSTISFDNDDIDVTLFTMKSRSYSRRSSNKIYRYKDITDFHVSDKTVFCECNMPRGNYTRCENYVREHGVNVYLIEFKDGTVRKNFCDILGLSGNEFILTSNLPKPVYASRGTKNALPKASTFKYIEQPSYAQLYKFWQEVQVDISQGGFYIPMRYSGIVNKENRLCQPQWLGNLLDCFNTIYPDKDLEIIGVKPSVIKLFNKSDKWVNIFDYITDLVNSAITNDSLGQHIANVKELEAFKYHSEYMALWRWRKQFMPLKPDGILHSLFDTITVMQQSDIKFPEYRQWQNLAVYCCVNIPPCKPQYDLSQYNKKINQSLPMLALVDGNVYAHIEKHIQSLKHYIHLVEGVKV